MMASALRTAKTDGSAAMLRSKQCGLFPLPGVHKHHPAPELADPLIHVVVRAACVAWQLTSTSAILAWVCLKKGMAR